MALQFDIKPIAAKHVHQFFQLAFCRGYALFAPRAAHWTFLIAGQSDQPLRKTSELVPTGEARAFAFTGIEIVFDVGWRDQSFAEFGFSDESAEILITGPGHCQQRDDGIVFHRQLETHEGAQLIVTSR